MLYILGYILGIAFMVFIVRLIIRFFRRKWDF
jgi:hypothetical protein